VDGILYLVRENGNLIAMDAKTGEQFYPEQRTHAHRHRASPLYADGKVYITARDGTITVIKAGKTFERLAENKMGDDMSASPIAANGTLYLRTFDSLYAIRDLEKRAQ
jgi:outer membrane protein assembly factor BamB